MKILESHPTFRIQWRTLKDSSPYFEMDTRYEIQIIDRRTNTIWKFFYRTEYMSATVNEDKGVDEIGFSEDGKLLCVLNEGRDQWETYALPKGPIT